MEGHSAAQSQVPISARLTRPEPVADPAVRKSLLFGREVELDELRQRITARASFLLHGHSGAGKTFLARIMSREYAGILYCPDSSSGQAVFRSLAAELIANKDPLVRRTYGRSAVSAIKTRSILALRGMVLSALRAGKYWVILDHLAGTSGSLACDVREMVFWGNTPVMAVARSTHMEDLGFLSAFFSLRSERMQVDPFNKELTMEFARMAAAQIGLRASNFEEFLVKVTERSGGLPGPIVTMAGMAVSSKYRMGDFIKFSPLYIDYRLSWHAANAY